MGSTPRETLRELKAAWDALWERIGNSLDWSWEVYGLIIAVFIAAGVLQWLADAFDERQARKRNTETPKRGDESKTNTIKWPE